MLMEQGQIGKARDELGQVGASLQRNISGMRRLLFDLRPSILDDGGLAPAIENYLNRLEEDNQICNFFYVDEGLDRLQPAIEITLYRLAQEALTNVRKHSKATEIIVNLLRRGEMIELSIQDNGVGFDVEDVLSELGYEEHFGLKSLIERVELAGGELKVESCMGEGTKVLVQVPERI